MLALVFADFLLNNLWSAPLVGSSPQDAYGVTIAVGDYMSLVGRVTAINLNDAHFGEIQIDPVHPATFGIPDMHYGNPQSQNFSPGNPQRKQKLGFHPQQLIHLSDKR